MRLSVASRAAAKGKKESPREQRTSIWISYPTVIIVYAISGFYPSWLAHDYNKDRT